MAFSTQKDFLEIGFLNERLEPVCARKGGVKLKSYASSTDSRAWAMNKETQAHFLTDLVACRHYAGDGQAIGTGTADEGGQRLGGFPPSDPSRGFGKSSQGAGGEDLPDCRVDTDSLLKLTREKLEDLHDKLKLSDEKIAILQDENKQIKKILEKDTDSEKLSPFHKKVGALRAEGKITVDDERELLQMQKFLGCKDKEYEVLGAENNCLKRLVEKLAARVKLNKIPVEKETSTDVNYLQSLVNDLREEIGTLRGIEEECAKLKVDMGTLKGKYDDLSSAEKEKRLNKDAEMMQAIIDERNNLRDQLAKMVGIEDKIALLRQRAMDADRLEKEIKSLKGKVNNLQEGSQHTMEAVKRLSTENNKLCKGLQNDAKALERCKAERDCLKQKCAEAEAQLSELDELREQLEEMCEELRNAHCKIKKMQSLEQELINTKKRLQRSERALEDYECQMHQLMDVIEELESQKCFCCCGQGEDSGDKVRDGHIEDLITASKLTLKQVQMEFDARTALQKELETSRHEIIAVKDEGSRLLDQVRRTSDAKIADLLKQLEQCKADNKKLKEEVKTLDEKLKQSTSELEAMKGRVDTIRQEVSGMETIVKEHALIAAPILEEEKPAVVEGKPARPPYVLEETVFESPALTEADKCCEEVKILKDQIIQEKQKCAAEKSLLENKLQDMTDLYTKAKDDCEKSRKSSEKLANELEEVSKVSVKREAQLDAFNSGVQVQKELLGAAKSELEQYRNELNKCNEKAQALENANKSLQDEINQLRNDNSELSKQLKDKENAIDELNRKNADLQKMLASCEDQIKKSHTNETKSDTELRNLKQSLDDCSAELNRLKAEKGNFDNMLATKDTEIKNAMGQLDKCRADLEALRKELQDKINSLQADKKALESQIATNKADLDQLSKLVSDIEAEREKNRKLETMVQDFESKLKQMPKEVPVAAPSAAEGQIKQAMDQLKGQLEQETARVNDLENQLAKCKQGLAEAEKATAAAKAAEAAAKAAEASAKAAEAAAIARADEAAAIAKAAASAPAAAAPAPAAAAPAPAAAAPAPAIPAPAVSAPAPAAPAPVPAAAPAAAAPAPVAPAPAPVSAPASAASAAPAPVEPTPDAPPTTASTTATPSTAATTPLVAKLRTAAPSNADDLIMSHDKEIAALKLANQALRNSLMNLKRGLGVPGEGMDMAELQKQIEELKKGACTCGKKKTCPMTKLQEICMKIVEQGIECLSLKELTYLHSEVYKAGLKLKPELVDSDKGQRCCKCTGFSCCLPNIAKDAEKRLINRIMCLENDVENANKILQHLKQCTDKKAPLSKTSYSGERYNICRVNDEINEFLKRTKDVNVGARKEVTEVKELYKKSKKPTARRKGGASGRDYC